MLKFAIALLLLLTQHPSNILSLQDQDQKILVQEHIVYATITNGNSLKPADLLLTIDGKPATVTDIEKVTTPPEMVAQKVSRNGDTTQDKIEAQRCVVIIFDNSSLIDPNTRTKDLGKIRQTVKAARSWINDESSRDIAFSIVELSLSPRVLADFTTDRGVLNSALNKVSPVMMLMTPRTMAFQRIDSAVYRTEDQSENVHHVLNAIKTFRALANALITNQYLTDVVLFSKGHEIHREFEDAENMPMASRGGGAGLMPEFYQATQRLERSDCRVHTISWAAIDDDTKMTAVEDSLAMFAHETGGLYASARNNVADQLAEVRSALADTYRIFVKVPDSIEPGMHELKITTKVKGVRIQHMPHIWVETVESRDQRKRDDSKLKGLPNRAVTLPYILN